MDEIIIFTAYGKKITKTHNERRKLLYMRRSPIEWIKYQCGMIPRYEDGVFEDRIYFYNWLGVISENEWYYRFLKTNLPKTAKFNLFGVVGKPLYLKRHPNRHNILVSGENLHQRFTRYRDYCLDAVGLAIGYDEVDADNYMRFPLWLIYLFEPVIDIKMIRQRIAEINSAKSSAKYECALVSSHDKWHTRQPIYDGLKDILDIQCAGKLYHNTDVLWDQYDNDKINFLHDCKFNICPENEDTPLYVTEKLFEAFKAGTIPIYMGAANNPEPDIINHDAILFWDKNNKIQNEACRKEVLKLKQEEDYYSKFMEQKKFQPQAAELIYDKFAELQRRLLALC